MRFSAVLALASVAIASPIAAPADTFAVERRATSAIENELTAGSCKDVIFVFARGSTEVGNMVRTVFNSPVLKKKGTLLSSDMKRSLIDKKLGNHCRTRCSRPAQETPRGGSRGRPGRQLRGPALDQLPAGRHGRGQRGGDEDAPQPRQHQMPGLADRGGRLLPGRRRQPPRHRGPLAGRQGQDQGSRYVFPKNTPSLLNSE